jgi:hypothetical protein
MVVTTVQIFMRWRDLEVVPLRKWCDGTQIPYIECMRWDLFQDLLTWVVLTNVSLCHVEILHGPLSRSGVWGLQESKQVYILRAPLEAGV